MSKCLCFECRDRLDIYVQNTNIVWVRLLNTNSLDFYIQNIEITKTSMYSEHRGCLNMYVGGSL